MSTGPQGYGDRTDPNQPSGATPPAGGQQYGHPYSDQPYSPQPHGAQPNTAQPNTAQPYSSRPDGSRPDGYAPAAAGLAPDVAAGGELARSQYWSEPRGQAAGQGQPGWGGPQYRAMPVAPVIVPKNGGLGVLVSFFIPGVGSMINGSVGLGVAILISYIVSWLLTIVLIGIPLVIGVWIWGMVDGYRSAQRWNQAHGIIS
jgi:TM2 domain-containing membrane protein YozV